MWSDGYLLWPDVPDWMAEQRLQKEAYFIEYYLYLPILPYSFPQIKEQHAYPPTLKAILNRRQ